MKYQKTPVMNAVAILTALCALSAIHHNVLAQTLPEVTVTATRAPDKLENIFQSVSVLTSDEVGAKQANSLAEAMKSAPNVEFGGGPRVNGQLPTIRGQQNASVAVLLDGGRQNDATGNTLRSPVYVDPYFLQQIEVLKGPASSLYGSGAMGGVITMKTFSAKDLLQSGETFGSQVKAGWADADNSKHANARLYGKSGPVDMLLALGSHQWGAMHKSNGLYLNPNDGDSKTALVKVGLQTSDSVRYELGLTSYDSKALLPTNPQSDFALNDAKVQPNRTLAMQTTLSATTKASDGSPQLAARIYSSRNSSENDVYKYTTTTQQYTFNETKTTGGSVQYNTKLQTESAGQHKLATGLDYHQDVGSALTGFPAGVIVPNTVNPDGTQTVAGVFIQDEITLGKVFHIIPGARWDRFESVAKDPSFASNINSHLSPKLTVAWDAAPGLSVYSSYGEAFRAPTLSELYSFLNLTSGFSQFRSNPSLEPELSTTTELGANYSRKGLWNERDVLSVRATVFESNVKNLINNTVIGTYTLSVAPFTTNRPIQQAQNVANAKRYGGELEVKYEMGAWEFALGYGSVRAVDTKTNTNLFANPDKTSLTLKHYMASDVSLAWVNTMVQAQDYDSTALRRRSAYNVHDVFLDWQPAGRKYKLALGITNLLDSEYYVYQSSLVTAKIPEAARNIRVGISMDF